MRMHQPIPTTPVRRRQHQRPRPSLQRPHGAPAPLLGPLDPQLSSARLEALGARLTAARLARGARQTDLARAAHLSQTHISQIERGVRLPPLDTLCVLAQLLGLDLGELLEVPARTPAAPHQAAGRQPETSDGRC